MDMYMAQKGVVLKRFFKVLTRLKYTKKNNRGENEPTK